MNSSKCNMSVNHTAGDTNFNKELKDIKIFNQCNSCNSVRRIKHIKQERSTSKNLKMGLSSMIPNKDEQNKKEQTAIGNCTRSTEEMAVIVTRIETYISSHCLLNKNKRLRIKTKVTIGENCENREEAKEIEKSNASTANDKAERENQGEGSKPLSEKEKESDHPSRDKIIKKNASSNTPTPFFKQNVVEDDFMKKTKVQIPNCAPAEHNDLSPESERDKLKSACTSEKENKPTLIGKEDDKEGLDPLKEPTFDNNKTKNKFPLHTDKEKENCRAPITEQLNSIPAVPSNDKKDIPQKAGKEIDPFPEKKEIEKNKVEPLPLNPKNTTKPFSKDKTDDSSTLPYNDKRDITPETHKSVPREKNPTEAEGEETCEHVPKKEKDCIAENKEIKEKNITNPSTNDELVEHNVQKLTPESSNDNVNGTPILKENDKKDSAPKSTQEISAPKEKQDAEEITPTSKLSEKVEIVNIPKLPIGSKPIEIPKRNIPLQPERGESQTVSALNEKDCCLREYKEYDTKPTPKDKVVEYTVPRPSSDFSQKCKEYNTPNLPNDEKRNTDPKLIQQEPKESSSPQFKKELAVCASAPEEEKDSTPNNNKIDENITNPLPKDEVIENNNSEPTQYFPNDKSDTPQLSNDYKSDIITSSNYDEPNENILLHSDNEKSICRSSEESEEISVCATEKEKSSSPKIKENEEKITNVFPEHNAIEENIHKNNSEPSSNDKIDETLSLPNDKKKDTVPKPNHEILKGNSHPEAKEESPVCVSEPIDEKNSIPIDKNNENATKYLTKTLLPKNEIVVDNDSKATLEHSSNKEECNTPKLSDNKNSDTTKQSNHKVQKDNIPFQPEKQESTPVRTTETENLSSFPNKRNEVKTTNLLPKDNGIEENSPKNSSQLSLNDKVDTILSLPSDHKSDIVLKPNQEVPKETSHPQVEREVTVFISASDEEKDSIPNVRKDKSNIENPSSNYSPEKKIMEGNVLELTLEHSLNDKCCSTLRQPNNDKRDNTSNSNQTIPKGNSLPKLEGKKSTLEKEELSPREKELKELTNPSPKVEVIDESIPKIASKSSPNDTVDNTPTSTSDSNGDVAPKHSQEISNENNPLKSEREESTLVSASNTEKNSSPKDKEPKENKTNALSKEIVVEENIPKSTSELPPKDVGNAQKSPDAQKSAAEVPKENSTSQVVKELISLFTLKGKVLEDNASKPTLELSPNDKMDNTLKLVDNDKEHTASDSSQEEPKGNFLLQPERRESISATEKESDYPREKTESKENTLKSLPKDKTIEINVPKDTLLPNDNKIYTASKPITDVFKENSSPRHGKEDLLPKDEEIKENTMHPTLTNNVIAKSFPKNNSEYSSNDKVESDSPRAETESKENTLKSLPKDKTIEINVPRDTLGLSPNDKVNNSSMLPNDNKIYTASKPIAEAFKENSSPRHEKEDLSPKDEEIKENTMHPNLTNNVIAKSFPKNISESSSNDKVDSIPNLTSDSREDYALKSNKKLPSKTEKEESISVLALKKEKEFSPKVEEIKVNTTNQSPNYTVIDESISKNIAEPSSNDKVDNSSMLPKDDKTYTASNPITEEFKENSIPRPEKDLSPKEEEIEENSIQPTLTNNVIAKSFAKNISESSSNDKVDSIPNLTSDKREDSALKSNKKLASKTEKEESISVPALKKEKEFSNVEEIKVNTTNQSPNYTVIDESISKNIAEPSSNDKVDNSSMLPKDNKIYTASNPITEEFKENSIPRPEKDLSPKDEEIEENSIEPTLTNNVIAKSFAKNISESSSNDKVDNIPNLASDSREDSALKPNKKLPAESMEYEKEESISVPALKKEKEFFPKVEEIKVNTTNQSPNYTVIDESIPRNSAEPSSNNKVDNTPNSLSADKGDTAPKSNQEIPEEKLLKTEREESISTSTDEKYTPKDKEIKENTINSSPGDEVVEKSVSMNISEPSLNDKVDSTSALSNDNRDTTSKPDDELLKENHHLYAGREEAANKMPSHIHPIAEYENKDKISEFCADSVINTIENTESEPDRDVEMYVCRVGSERNFFIEDGTDSELFSEDNKSLSSQTTDDSNKMEFRNCGKTITINRNKGNNETNISLVNIPDISTLKISIGGKRKQKKINSSPRECEKTSIFEKNTSTSLSATDNEIVDDGDRNSECKDFSLIRKKNAESSLNCEDNLKKGGNIFIIKKCRINKKTEILITDTRYSNEICMDDQSLHSNSTQYSNKRNSGDPFSKLKETETITECTSEIRRNEYRQCDERNPQSNEIHTLTTVSKNPENKEKQHIEPNILVIETHNDKSFQTEIAEQSFNNPDDLNEDVYEKVSLKEEVELNLNEKEKNIIPETNIGQSMPHSAVTTTSITYKPNQIELLNESDVLQPSTMNDKKEIIPQIDADKIDETCTCTTEEINEEKGKAFDTHIMPLINIEPEKGEHEIKKEECQKVDDTQLCGNIPNSTKSNKSRKVPTTNTCNDDGVNVSLRGINKKQNKKLKNISCFSFSGKFKGNKNECYGNLSDDVISKINATIEFLNRLRAESDEDPFLATSVAATDDERQSRPSIVTTTKQTPTVVGGFVPKQKVIKTSKKDRKIINYTIA